VKELWVETVNAAELKPLLNKYCDWLVEGDKATPIGSSKFDDLHIVVPKKGEDLSASNVRTKILRICISDKESENQIVEAAENGASYLIISCANWRVIPLENLIQKNSEKL
jgi:3-dehydroquinate synthase class II